MLVIHPDQCIDCGVCVVACPASAIISDTEPNAEKWLEFNRIYAEKWPSITQKGTPPGDADQWCGVPDKLQYLITGEESHG